MSQTAFACGIRTQLSCNHLGCHLAPADVFSANADDTLELDISGNDDIKAVKEHLLKANDTSEPGTLEGAKVDVPFS